MKLRTLLTTLALAVGVTTAATAATPTAVWDGDFSFAKQNGYTLSLKSGGALPTTAGALSLAADVLKIDKVDTTTTYANSAIVIKYSGYTANSLANTALASAYVNGGSEDAGVEANGGYMKAYWGTTVNRTLTTQIGSYSKDDVKIPSSGYLILAYNTGTGTAGFVADRNKTEWKGGYDNGIKWSNKTVYGFAVGGPRQASPAGTMGPCATMTIEAVAVFENYNGLTQDGIEGLMEYSFPGKHDAYGAVWSNIGVEGVAGGIADDDTTFDNADYQSFSIDFGKTQNISTTEIGAKGKVKLTKVVFLKRSADAPTMPTTVTVSQGSKSVQGTITEGTTQRKVYGYKYPETSNYFWTKTVEQTITFAEDADPTFDTTQPIAFEFPSNFGVLMFSKPNCIGGLTATYGPCVEVVGDYVETRPRVVSYSVAQCWGGSTTGLLTGDSYLTMVGNIPLAAWSQPVTDASDVELISGGYGSILTISKYWDGTSAQTFTDVANFKVRAHITGGTNLLGKDANLTTDFSDFRTAVNQAKNKYGAADDFEITNIPFDYYDVILYFAGNGGTMNAVQMNDGSYYKPNSTTPGDNTVSGSSSTWGESSTSDLIYGKNAMRIDNLSGATLKLMQNCAAYGIAAVQIVERKVNAYTATVAESTDFSELEWTPAKPSSGFEDDAELTINNTAAATVTFDEAVSVGMIKVVNESGKALGMTFDETVNATWDFTGAEGGLSFASLDGTELAKNAVVGVPYSYWVVSGVISGTPTVTCPTMPKGYTATYETVANYGVRLIVTAPDTAQFNAISVNMKNGHDIASGTHGAYPVYKVDWNELTKNKLTGTFGGATFTLSGKTGTFYQMSGVGDDILYDYIDDANGQSITLTVENVPFAKYRVITYYNADSNGSPFCPMVVNGVSYSACYKNGTASTTVKGSFAIWGLNTNRGTLAEGVNYLISDTLTDSTATITITSQRGTARGTPAAYQIVEVGDYIKEYTATVTGDADFSALDWSPAKPEGGFPEGADFVLTNNGSGDPTTVTIDSAVNAAKIKVVGASKTLKLAGVGNLTVSTLEADTDATLAVSGTPASLANLTVAGAVTFEDTVTFASGNALTVNGTLTGGFTFNSGSSLSFGTSGALVIPSGKLVDWQANITNAKHRELLAKTSGDGTLKMTVSGSPELQIHSDTAAHTANVNVEYLGTGEILFVGSDRAAIDKYTVSAGKTVKFENGTIWPKRSVFYVDGTLIAKYFKLGHESDGSYTGKITVNDGGCVKIEKVTFTNKGGNSGLDIQTGGVFEFLQNESSAIALASFDKTYSVVLNGGTLKAETSSWYVDSDIAMTIGADSIISAAADKTIKIAGVISGSGNVSVTGAGSVILNGANTDTGTYTVASGASLTLGTSPTVTIDGASQGTITVTLTAEEKTALDGGNPVQLIGVSGETFAGTLKAQDISGAAYEINAPTISEGKLVVTKKEGARMSPFSVTNPTNENWTIAGWTDATTPVALDVRPEDWANKASANVTVEAEQNKTLMADRVLTIGTLTITNAGTLAVSASGANTLTADDIVIDNSGTATLTGSIAISGTIDDGDSTGKTTLDFAPGAASITAGADTILASAGTGTYTIGADKKLTVKGGSLASTQVSNSGTLSFEGGTEESPINLSGTSDFGTVTLAADTYVVNTENAANHKHVVTGQGATSYYGMMREGGASPGMLDGTTFSNLILVSKCYGNDKKVWLEHTTMTDGTVGFKLDGPLVLNGSDVTIRSLAGSAALTRAGSQTLTIRCKEDAEFSGACKVPVVIGEGDGLQTFSGSMTSTLTVNEDATVRLTGSASPTSIAVEGTVYFSCATDKTYANAITGAGNIIVNNDGETGAVKFTGDLSGFTGTITYRGGSYDIGTMRTYSVPSYITLESGVTIKATQTAAEYAQGLASAFTGFTEGQTITLKKLDGASDVLTVDAEGKASSTASGEVHIDGAATYADATFTNATSKVSGQAHCGTLSYKSISGLGLQYDDPVTTNSTGTGAYLKHHPWITGLPNSFMQSEEMTIAVVGEMSPSNDTVFVHFGTTTGSNKGIYLATGSKTDEVVVKMNTGTAVTDITTMTVPHAATARHVYIITKKDVGDESTVSVYLDGTPWKTAKFSKISLTGGVQCGSDHGGELHRANPPVVNAVTSDDTALINVLRVYDRVISKAEIDAYSSAYPYVSDSGTSSRTFAAAAEDWIGAEDAKLWSFKQTATSEAVLTNAPIGTSSVEIDGTEDVTTTIAVNLDADEHAESVMISSPGAFKFAKAEGKAGLIVSGQTTIGCPVEIEYKSLDISGAPLTLIDEGAVVFDLSGIDLSTYFADATILLTGDVEETDRITVKNLTQVAGRTATFGYNGTQYVLTIAVDTSTPFIYTIAGWTWNGAPVAAEVVSNNTALAITVQSDLEWNIDRSTFTVDGGTLKATKAGTATITINEGGTFDLNGLGNSLYSVILNGGSLVNNGAKIGDENQVCTITLTKDSTVGGTGDFSLQGNPTLGKYGTTSMDLGTYTLTKAGTNSFALVFATVNGAGTIYVTEGALYSSESTTFTDATASIKVGANGTLRQRDGRKLTVSNIIGEGGTFNNEGEVSGFTLTGTLAIANAGSWGTITNAADAVVNIGAKRGLTFAGVGMVNVTLTDSEFNTTGDREIFTLVDGAETAMGTITYAGQDITDKCTRSGGTITAIDHEAKIGTTYYLTFAAALDAAQANETVSLLKDIELAETLSIAKAITLDLGDKTVTLSAAQMGIVINADATVQNGSIKSSLTANDCKFAVYVNPGKSPTLKNLSIDAAYYEYGLTCDSQDFDPLSAAYDSDPASTVTCENVDVTGNGTLIYAQWCNVTLDADCSAIRDAELPLFTANVAHQAAIYAALNAKVTVADGTYTHVNAIQTGSLGATIIANGGTFNGGVTSFMAWQGQNKFAKNIGTFTLNAGTYNGAITFMNPDAGRDQEVITKGADVVLAVPADYGWDYGTTLAKMLKWYASVYADGEYFTWAGLGEGNAFYAKGTTVKAEKCGITNIADKTYFVTNIVLKKSGSYCTFSYDGTKLTKVAGDLDVTIAEDGVTLSYDYTTGEDYELDSLGHACFSRIDFVEYKASGKAVAPGGAPLQVEAESAEAATNGVTIVAKSPDTSIVSDDDYSAYFYAKAVELKTKPGHYNVYAALKPEIMAAEEPTESLATSLGAIAAGTATEAEITGAKPGLWYSVKYTDVVSDMANAAEGDRAQAGVTGAVTIKTPKTESGAANQFYQVQVSTADKGMFQ